MSGPSRERLVEVADRTFSSQAGLTLRDTPAPLFQLLSLCILLAKPLSADLGVEACWQLRKAKLTTPQRMVDATWQERVDALVRAHYRRYDESSATILGEAAQFVVDRYRGDLRRLATAADGDAATAARLLGEVPGIGPTGADIFLREVQAVWPWLRPFVDHRVLDGARRVGLPHSKPGLTRWLGDGDPTAVVAALVRVSLDDDLVERVRATDS
jgi:hypothetical protein